MMVLSVCFTASFLFPSLFCLQVFVFFQLQVKQFPILKGSGQPGVGIPQLPFPKSRIRSNLFPPGYRHDRADDPSPP